MPTSSYYDSNSKTTITKGSYTMGSGGPTVIDLTNRSSGSMGFGGKSGRPDFSGFTDQVNNLYQELKTTAEGLRTEMAGFTTEVAARPFTEMWDRFQSQLSNKVAQDAEYQQENMRSQARNSRDPRGWAVTNQLADADRKVKQDYVRGIMEMNQWYAEKVAATHLQTQSIRNDMWGTIGQFQAQAMTSIASYLASIAGVEASMYGAELQASVAYAQMRNARYLERRREKSNEKLAKMQWDWALQAEGRQQKMMQDAIAQQDKLRKNAMGEFAELFSGLAPSVQTVETQLTPASSNGSYWDNPPFASSQEADDAFNWFGNALAESSWNAERNSRNVYPATNWYPDQSYDNLSVRLAARFDDPEDTSPILYDNFKARSKFRYH